MIAYRPFVAALALAGLAGLHYPAAAEVQFSRQVEMVDLPTAPTLPNSLIMDMARSMPKVGSEHALAVTHGQVKWTYKTKSYGGLCSVHSVMVEVQTRVRLPEWPRWREAPAIWQDAWTCIDKYLVAHENTHVDIWRETADDIDAALAEFARAEPCDGFAERAKAAAQRAHDIGRQKQKAFDAGQKRFDDVNTCIAEFVASAEPERAKAKDASRKAAGRNAASATVDRDAERQPDRQDDGGSSAASVPQEMQQRLVAFAALGMAVLGVAGAGFKAMMRSSVSEASTPPSRGGAEAPAGVHKIPARRPTLPATPTRGEFAARTRQRKP